jgi:hypothetical protein
MGEAVWMLFKASFWVFVGLSFCALVASVRQWRAGDRGRSGKSGGRLWKAGLVMVGPVAVAVSYALAERLAFPLVRQLVWPIVRSLTAGQNWVERESVYSFEQVVAVGATTALAMATVGLAVGRRRIPGPLAGYWLANPLSITLGYLPVHALGTCLSLTAQADYPWWSEYTYWDGVAWVGLVILASPLYSWLFRAATVWSGSRASGPTRA